MPSDLRGVSWVWHKNCWLIYSLTLVPATGEPKERKIIKIGWYKWWLGQTMSSSDSMTTRGLSTYLKFRTPPEDLAADTWHTLKIWWQILGPKKSTKSHFWVFFPRCIFGKYTQLACLLSFASFFSRYPPFYVATKAIFCQEIMAVKGFWQISFLHWPWCILTWSPHATCSAEPSTLKNKIFLFISSDRSSLHYNVRSN